MITAVDTNILLDVFGADAKFGRASAAALKQCIGEGAIVACDIVWGETAAAFSSHPQFLEAMETLGMVYSPMDRESAFQAGAAWRAYRAKGGRRERVAADFLIGAHALVQCERLLTRDRGFYRGYFAGLKVLDP